MLLGQITTSQVKIVVNCNLDEDNFFLEANGRLPAFSSYNMLFFDVLIREY